jgi:hypothetical protein
MAGAGLLEGVSLGEVDAGLVRDSEWDSADPTATWIEVGAIRNGYHLLVGKGAGQEDWILRWNATPELVESHENPEFSDAK